MELLRYILRRTLLSAFVVVGVTFLVFVVAQVVPSDPAALYAGPRPTAEQIEKARQELNLDAPLPARFATFAAAMATGDFGISYKSRRLIAQDLRAYLPATLELAVFSTGLALIIGIPLGVLAAARQGRWPDKLGSFGSIAAVAMPTFFLAMILQLVFSQWLGILPLSGRLAREISISAPLPMVTGFNMIDALLAGRLDAFQGRPAARSKRARYGRSKTAGSSSFPSLVYDEINPAPRFLPRGWSCRLAPCGRRLERTGPVEDQRGCRCRFREPHNIASARRAAGSLRCARLDQPTHRNWLDDRTHRRRSCTP
ncbi:ABC transporter permease [Rhizobium sp. LjRoot98]|uniref:ABC transporter permease n=1 Tax=Rhizobium sp. LjRoot98 TaxID=3342345 RepID=UPI003ECFFB28